MDYIATNFGVVVDIRAISLLEHTDKTNSHRKPNTAR